MNAQVIVVYLFAFIAVIAAVMVVSRDNPVHSALWLILNLVCLAVLYYTLNAPFLMVVQLIVYAGAIVVLFLFVVMLLSSKGQPGGTSGPIAWLTPATFVAAILLGGLLLLVAFAQPRTVPGGSGGALIGTPTNIGRVLFRDYLLPFEATSILLLAALVGALYLGRHSDREELDEEDMALEESLGGPEGAGGEGAGSAYGLVAGEETARVPIPEDINA